MHLGNGVICPVTGLTIITAMGFATYWAFEKAKKDFTKEKFLHTVVLTALIFGLQMINFSIPQTGSSGHIIGGVLLAALLGPYVGFLSICLILLVQTLFFADGGLMAIGCNIFNMGFLACFVAYPYIYKPISEKKHTVFGAILASVIAVQLGSIAIVTQAAFSGSTTNALSFALLMQGIHFVIGIVEGVVTAGVILIAQNTQFSKGFLLAMGLISLILTGLISNYASIKPDGLQWALLKLSNSFVEQTQGQIYSISEAFQAKTAILADIPYSALANILGLLIITLIATILCSIILKKKNTTSGI